MRRTLPLLAVALLLAGCAAPSVAVHLVATPTPTAIPTAESCAIQAAPFLAEVEPVIAAWDDTVTLAGHTARASLAPVISQLQEIRRGVAATQPPECAASAKLYLVASMDETINAYLAFMAQEPDREVSARFDAAAEALDAATAALYEIRTGEPAPTRTPRPTATPVPSVTARAEAAHTIALTGLTVMNCKIVRTWMGQTLTVRVQGLAPDADVTTLRPAMEASVAILHDRTIAGFALHIADKDDDVVRTVGVRRDDVSNYSRGALSFESFADCWEYR